MEIMSLVFQCVKQLNKKDKFHTAPSKIQIEGGLKKKTLNPTLLSKQECQSAFISLTETRSCGLSRTKSPENNRELEGRANRLQ